jgi:hypothetical protein
VLRAIGRGEALIELASAPGSGKTTLLGELARRLRSPGRRVVLAFHGPDEEATLSDLLARLGVARSRFSAWSDLARASRLARSQKIAVVILLDDAHDASRRLMAKRLAAIDASAAWSVVAAGRVRPIEEEDEGDRLVVRVEALTRDEANFFVTERIAADGRDPSRFPPPSLTRLHARAGGVPRRLLRLAHAALDAADASRRVEVGPGDIDDAADETTTPLGFGPGAVWPEEADLR